MDALMKKAIINARRPGYGEGCKPSATYKRKMPFMTMTESHPAPEVKTAFSDCFEEVKTTMPVANLMRFQGMLQVYTLPFQREHNGYDLAESPELEHAMRFFTPGFLKTIKNQSVKNLDKLIRDRCFTPPVEGLSPIKVDQVIETLKYHFSVAENLPDAGFVLPGEG